MNLQELGFTKEDIERKLIDRLVTEFMGDRESRDGGFIGGRVRHEVESKIQTTLSEQVLRIFSEQVTPVIFDMVKSTVLRETNNWGEPRGNPIGLTEFLVSEARKLLKEQVNEKGNPKRHSDYGWTAVGPRINVLVQNGLRESIASVVKEALAAINTKFADAMRAAVDAALGNLQTTVKVEERKE